MMDRLSFLILSVLKSCRAINSISAITVMELVKMEEFMYRPNTIYKKIQELKKETYIEEGMKDGKAYTYFITKKGMNYLIELKER